jgi:hypothetical protein
LFLNYISTDDSFDLFLLALRESKLQPIPFDESFSYLPLTQGGATLLGMHSEGSRLFVPSAYNVLWQRIVSTRDEYLASAIPNRGIALIGNAGVGKSLSLVYVLKQLSLLSPPPVVVYDNISSNRSRIIRPDSPVTELFDPTSTFLTDANVVYLVDVGSNQMGRFPANSNAFTVLVSTAHLVGDTLSDWFKQQRPIKLYLSVSPAEVEACRHLTHPTVEEKAAHTLLGELAPAWWEVDIEESKQLTKEFGPVPRVAIYSTEADKHRKEVKRALAQCDLNKVVGQAESEIPDLLSGTSNWLLHYVVDPNTLQFTGIRFASDAIAMQVFEALETRDSDQLMRFVRATSGSSVWASARGIMLEKHVGHLFRQAGGTFTIQQLRPPWDKQRNSPLRIGPARSVTFPKAILAASPLSTLADIQSLQAGCYGRPVPQNFPAIDGVFKMATSDGIQLDLAQDTVAEAHNVDLPALISAVAGLKVPGPSPRFFFDVPPDIFHSCRVRSLVPNYDDKFKDIEKLKKANVQFFVRQLFEAPIRFYSRFFCVFVLRHIFLVLFSRTTSVSTFPTSSMSSSSSLFTSAPSEASVLSPSDGPGNFALVALIDLFLVCQVIKATGAIV